MVGVCSIGRDGVYVSYTSEFVVTFRGTRYFGRFFFYVLGGLIRGLFLLGFVLLSCQ